MKGHFSIEWLSQSSRATGSQCPVARTGPCSSPGSPGPSTSGTVPESLPGFYSRRRQDSTDPREKHAELPAGPARGFPKTPKPDAGSGNRTSPQHNTQVPEAGFSSTEEEETSGYESEGGRSLSPVASNDAVPSTSPSTGRRPRTAFTAEQISSLERAFKRNAYLGTQDKAELCKRLNLSDKQIRNWFQNRRMKLKRTVQDALAQACQVKVASHLMHYPELQAFRAGPYPGYCPAQDGLASYLCPSSLHYSSSAVGAVPALAVDALYPYSSLPSLAIPPGSSPLVAHYQPYHHQY